MSHSHHEDGASTSPIIERDLASEVLTLLSFDRWESLRHLEPNAERADAVNLLVNKGCIECRYRGVVLLPSGHEQIALLIGTGTGVDEKLKALLPEFHECSREYRATSHGHAVRCLFQGRSKEDVFVAINGNEDLPPELSPENQPVSSTDNEGGDALLKITSEADSTAIELFTSLPRDWLRVKLETSGVELKAAERLISAGLAEAWIAGSVIDDSNGNTQRLSYIVSGFLPQENVKRLAARFLRDRGGSSGTFETGPFFWIRLTESGQRLKQAYYQTEVCMDVLIAIVLGAEIPFRHTRRNPEDFDLADVPDHARNLIASLKQETRNQIERDMSANVKSETAPDVPTWDIETFTLAFRGAKRTFRPLAENPIKILTTFQELGWPRRVDSPLPVEASLTEAVRTLCSKVFPIRFLRDGTGEGIMWEESST